MKPRSTSAIAIAIVAFPMSGCLKEEWEGFVYPNKNDLTGHINIDIYKSLDECRIGCKCIEQNKFHLRRLSDVGGERAMTRRVSQAKQGCVEIRQHERPGMAAVEVASPRPET